jgi:cyclic pyranopterin phosphate synthase
MSAGTVELLREQALPKGDALNTARIAGVMAAKRTPDLIPLCHGLNLTSVDVEFEVGKEEIGIVATARASDRTGVEMEALTAVSVAALTIYDMCKAVDKGMVIGDVRLLEKTKEQEGA